MLSESGLKAELLVIPDQCSWSILGDISCGLLCWDGLWFEVCLQLVAPELPAGWSTCTQVFPDVLSANETYCSPGRGSAAALPVYRQAFPFAWLRG